MATNENPIFIKTVSSPATQFTSADTTIGKAVFTAGPEGGAVMNLNATSSDSATIIAQLSVNDGVLTNIIGEVTIAIGAGTDGATPAVNLLDPDQIRLFQNDGSLLLGPNASLEVNCRATMTTGTLAITAGGGSYSAG